MCRYKLIFVCYSFFARLYVQDNRAPDSTAWKLRIIPWFLRRKVSKSHGWKVKRVAIWKTITILYFMPCVCVMFNLVQLEHCHASQYRSVWYRVTICPPWCPWFVYPRFWCEWKTLVWSLLEETRRNVFVKQKHGTFLYPVLPRLCFTKLVEAWHSVAGDVFRSQGANVSLGTRTTQNLI